MHIFDEDTVESSRKIKAELSKTYGPIAKTSNGKPHFVRNPSIGISIAHDGDLTIGAVASGQIGIDIVNLPLEVEFNYQELSWLFHPVPEPRDVPYYWAAREAFIKCKDPADVGIETPYDPNHPIEVNRNRFTSHELPQMGAPLILMDTPVYLFQIRNCIGAVCLEQSSQENVTRVLESFMGTPEV